ncbi:hypothetical protein G6F22_019162 [Rhizopus arrhizus]|nr:hypothetical protein G6F22_019162 [Rhizopus arrhizus]KAG1361658.1 hypothetical protein G6F61_014224 [Rhizopus arrhizus]
MQRRLEDIAAAVDDAGFLALGQLGAIGGRGEEAAQPGAGCAQPFGDGALWHAFQFNAAAAIQVVEDPGMRGLGK